MNVTDKTSFMKLKKILQTIGIIAIIITLVPLIAMSYWWIRLFDYPHVQLTVFTFFALALYFIRFEAKNKKDYLFVSVLFLCFIFQFIKISDYIPHRIYEAGEASKDVSQDDLISLYIANVLQDNTNPDLLIAEIKAKQPDVLLLMETNTRWQQDVAETVANYPFKVEVPLDNTYGMLLYSKLELITHEVAYLIDDSIPSIQSRVRLRSGKEIKLHAIHPTPPKPSPESRSSKRTGELMKIALKVVDADIPVVVAGDFNDVSWSNTMVLFKSVSGLLDTRNGRGFYNSFDANSLLMRWPLDYVYVTEEFRVQKLGLGEDIDSDHFPVEITLSLEPDRAGEQKPEKPTQNQIDRANKYIEEVNGDDFF